MIRNAAHDSVCACSIDDVCAAVLHRYRDATDIALELTDTALKALANPSPTATQTMAR